MTQAEIDQLQAETLALVREYDDLTKRQRAVLQDTASVLASLAAIRASNSWRLLESYRRARQAIRGGRMRAEGLLATVSAQRGPRPVSPNVRRAPLGVNIAGYINTESGMGEAVRASIRSVEATGIPVSLNNVDSFLRKNDVTYTAFARDNPHPFNLVHLNADNMAAFRRAKGSTYFADRYTIGYWFWELSTFRDDWRSAFGYVDEIWVASEFTRACLVDWTHLPVVHMPLPVVIGPAADYGRAHFGIPAGPAVLLYTFDVSSQTERKNPLGVIRAFRRAGLPHGEAVLVLKFTNAEYDREAVRRFHHEAEGLNVVMLDGYFDRPELMALMSVADCYVSLHRAEGFGLTMAEAMAIGKPVIATNYSGNVDFMTNDTALLVDYRLVPLMRDHGPYLRGSVWADADLAQAADFIRQVVRSPQRARALGACAAAHMTKTRSPQVTGAHVHGRLTAIRRGTVLTTIEAAG